MTSFKPIDLEPHYPIVKIKNDAHYASWMHERIIRQINDFEEGLPDDMEAGGRFVSSCDGTTYNIKDVSYWNPDMIIFDCLSQNGEKIRLLQHVSQLNLLLVAVPRKDDLTHPRRKIGFHSQDSPPAESSDP